MTEQHTYTPSPWDALAKELEATEGHWADYVAWKRWACENSQFAEAVDSLDECDLAQIYGRMVDLWQAKCRVPHDPDKPKPLTWEKPTPDMLFGDGDEFLVAVPVKSRHGGKDYYEYSVVRASCDGDDEDARLDFNTDEGNWAWSWDDVEYFIALDRFRLPEIAEKPHDPDDAALVAFARMCVAWTTVDGSKLNMCETYLAKCDAEKRFLNGERSPAFTAEMEALTNRMANKGE